MTGAELVALVVKIVLGLAPLIAAALAGRARDAAGTSQSLARIESNELKAAVAAPGGVAAAADRMRAGTF